MKSILSCLMLIVAFSLTSSADVQKNDDKLVKQSLSSSSKEFSNVIILPNSGIRDLQTIRKAQQKYIKKLYPNHRVILSVYLKDQKNRYIEAVSCIDSDNEMVQVYFDMGNVYQYLKSKNEKIREEVEQLEKSYMLLK